MSQETAVTHEPYVGKTLESRSFPVSQETLDDYYHGLALSDPSQAGALPVPTMLASGSDNGYFDQICFSNHFGHLWMRQEWELFAPLQVGQSYESTGRISDIYQRRDRNVVQYAIELRDSLGGLVLRSQHHQSFLLDQQSGELQFRDPKAKPGTRKFSVPEGESFGSLERTITLAMCDRFFGGDTNYHTDREASLKLGFRNVVVGGRMTMAYAGHILEERYGTAWSTSGRLDVKFTNPVWENDTVIARGVELGSLEDEPDRTAAFVWLAKPDDTIVLIASASVVPTA
jgi:acyl dehydratase